MTAGFRLTRSLLLRFETKLEPRDCWMGWFFDTKKRGVYTGPPRQQQLFRWTEYHVYYCPLPMCLLHVWLSVPRDEPKKGGKRGRRR